MKENTHFLSVPKFLQAAQDMGLDVTERTLQFYIAKNLLPKPVRRPFTGADGRVAYLPQDGLKRLRRILHLKNQGLKLEQIRRVLEGAGTQIPAADDWQKKVVFRYLRHLPATYASQSRSVETVEQLRDLQIENLSPVVGEEAAQQHVTDFYLQIPSAELRRHLRTMARGPRPLASSDAEVFFKGLQQATVDRLWQRVDEAAFLTYLGQVQRVFQHYRQFLDLPRVEPYLAPGWSFCEQALETLKSPQKSYRRPLQQLRRGLELLVVCHKMLLLEAEASALLEL